MPYFASVPGLSCQNRCVGLYVYRPLASLAQTSATSWLATAPGVNCGSGISSSLASGVGMFAPMLAQLIQESKTSAAFRFTEAQCQENSLRTRSGVPELCDRRTAPFKCLSWIADIHSYSCISHDAG